MNSMHIFGRGMLILLLYLVVLTIFLFLKQILQSKNTREG